MPHTTPPGVVVGSSFRCARFFRMSGSDLKLCRPIIIRTNAKKSSNSSGESTKHSHPAWNCRMTAAFCDGTSMRLSTWYKKCAVHRLVRLSTIDQAHKQGQPFSSPPFRTPYPWRFSCGKSHTAPRLLGDHVEEHLD